jgi:tight adherence protein C
VATTLFGGLVVGLTTLRHRRQARRLRSLTELDDVAGDKPAAIRPEPANTLTLWATATLPRIGAGLLPRPDSGGAALEERLRRAGFYQRQAAAMFLGIRICLAGVALATAVALLGFRLLPPWYALAGSGLALGLAVVLPGLYVDYCGRKRRDHLRRSLPDALDVMVICLEAGLSLPDAIRRVAVELQLVHPVLALEMNIIQREILLGLSPGDAMHRFGQRANLLEVRNLASVLLQSERFGTSTTKALRVQADQLRLRRQQDAEARAQRAAVWILFPMLFCIFPAVFLVCAGPAVFRIWAMFSQMK